MAERSATAARAITKPGTLTPLIIEYTGGRRRRGELSPGAARDYRITLQLLDATFGQRPLERFGPRAIDRWLESIGDRAPETRREYLSRVKGFCRWLVAHGHISEDPTAHVPPVRVPRRVPVTLTESHVAQLLEHVAGDARGTAIVWIMVGCGARCIEVSRLLVEDYDPVGRTFILRGKAGHERVVPVPQEVASAVNRYLDEVGWQAGPLIRSKRDWDRGRGISSHTISLSVSEWLCGAGVKSRALDGRSAHGLRRTAASDVMDRTGDITIVQAMLGHSKVETTAKHYLRPTSMEKLRAGMEGRSYAGPPPT
jgi:site-specific recombinase XerD